MDRHANAWHADQLCALVATARDRGNQLLDALARAPSGAPDAPFVYQRAAGQPVASIPAAAFHRPSALALAAVVLTLHGYCILHRPGPGGPSAAVFSLARPAWWRRLLRPAPLLALHVRAHPGTVTVDFSAAGRGAVHRGQPPRVILLPPALQDALLHTHRAHAAAPSVKSPFAQWLRRR